MSSDYDVLTLENIGGGVTSELFSKELEKVLENINDKNTPANAPRKIVLEFIIVPSELREGCHVSIRSSCKVAGIRPANSNIYLAENHGKMVALHHNLNQEDLFDNENVESLHAQGE